MTESWTIYIRVRGENTDSLYKTYEDLDEAGIDRVNRTGKAKVISTNCFECSEDDEIGIDITVEVPDEFDDMYDDAKEEMIYELFTCEYVDSWLGWFHDDLDDEDWRISVRYNGNYDTYEDGYYDGSPKENVHEDETKDEDEDEDIIRITKKDISHIHVWRLYPPNSNGWNDDDARIGIGVNRDSIEVNDIVYDKKYVTIAISGICTKYVKDDCTFECSIFMYVDEFSEAYRKDNSRIEFFDGEITIRNKETDITKKYKLSAPTLISVYLNKD